MATTRMRVSNSAQVFHRVALSADMAAHDVGTSDPAVSGLGGSGDFQLEADSDVTYRAAGTVVLTTGTGHAWVEDALSGACTKFLHIKHTGFTTAAKDTASTAHLMVGVGDPDAIGFELAPGESITFHDLGTSVDAISNWKCQSAALTIYAELTYL